jgi:hypothetical protein
MTYNSHGQESLDLHRTLQTKAISSKTNKQDSNAMTTSLIFEKLSIRQTMVVQNAMKAVCIFCFRHIPQMAVGQYGMIAV